MFGVGTDVRDAVSGCWLCSRSGSKILGAPKYPAMGWPTIRFAAVLAAVVLGCFILAVPFAKVHWKQFLGLETLRHCSNPTALHDNTVVGVVC